MTQRFASWLASGVVALMLVLCLLFAIAAFFPSLIPALPVEGGRQFRMGLLTGWSRVALPLILLPAFALQLYGLANLRHTFVSAARGEWFSSAAVTGFRRFAWAAVWLVPVGILQNSAMSMLLSMADPAIPDGLAVSVGSNELRALITALLFLFVAQIFSVGRSVDEDARSIL